jgi:neutral ceramidase
LTAQTPTVVTGGGFVAGSQVLFATDFSGVPIGNFPSGLKYLRGSMDVVSVDGVPMLRSTGPSEFIIPLNVPLPQDFTLEFDFVARNSNCCSGEELAFEGSPALNRSTGSAWVSWHHQYAAILGGGQDMGSSTVRFSEDLQGELKGQLGQIQVVMSGTQFKLFTNGRQIYNIPNLVFRRSNVLRVYLGGLDDGTAAVYLARVRLAVGGGGAGVVANQQGGVTGSGIAGQPSGGPIQPVSNPPAPGTPVSGPSVTPPASAGAVASGPLATPATAPVAGPLVTPPASAGALSSGPIATPAPAPVAGPSVTPPARAGGLPSGPLAPAPASALPPAPLPSPADILVGTGISDITGPVAGSGMMGYAQFSQIDMGLHTRLYARAFVFANPNGKRVVFVSAELAMLFSSVKQGVLKKLALRYPGRYDDRNVLLSATHTHSGPGGFSHHVQFNLTTLGHIAQNYAAIVDGITEAIVKADSSLAPATVAVTAGDIVASASVNRSMPAYTLNPDARWIIPPPSTGPRPLVPPPPGLHAYPDSINSEMTVLGIRRGGVPAGAISWFAVHNTSIGQKNLLVSSDHKGYAAYLFEKANGAIAPLENYGGFVAAFPNGAEGDLSPNLDVSNPTAFKGPGTDEFDSMEIIGYREYATAERLFIDPNQTRVIGDVDFRHSFVLMPGLPVPSSAHTNGLGLKFLCPGAYGVSFMAGAEDGPTGMLSEGLALGSTFSFFDLSLARAAIISTVTLLIPPLGPVITDVMVRSNDKCQEPKPVLIPSGLLGWTPEILPFQLLRIGPVAIAGIPGEMTVQAGRRLQARILTSLAPLGVQRVILTGLANEYSGYITTPEEYGSQQYEGASTLYGRLTFDGYLQEFGKLADAMAGGQAVAAGVTPLDLGLLPQIELQAGVDHDSVPPGERFGQVLTQPPSAVSRGTSVHVIYRSGHPKNDLRRNNSYFRIERQVTTSSAFPNGWKLEAWDSTPETKFFWGRSLNCPNPCYVSSVGITWAIPLRATPGTYRIRFVGSWKDGSNGGALVRYQGTTNTFTVQ